MIKIISAGLQTSIQDLGRYRYRYLGVPTSGVMDRKSAVLANHLLGNIAAAPLLEFGHQGPVLKFLDDTEIAITGAGFNPSVSGELFPLNKRIFIEKGSVMSFGLASSGVWAYLAVRGGVLVAPVLQSSSFHPAVSPQLSIQKESVLEIGSFETKLNRKNAVLRVSTNYFKQQLIEVYKGPEFESLNKETQKELFKHTFTISGQSNRMATILNHNLKISAPEIITSAVQPGTVQLTPSGKMMVLMRDAQTTGGYARILQLRDEAVSIVSQIKVGESVALKLI
ncbi:MAG: biotin-dependent carboxyltransferase family protein [Flavobacteriaceae bacterium]